MRFHSHRARPHRLARGRILVFSTREKMARHISRSRRFALVLALLALNAPVVRAGGFIHAVESWFSPSLDEAPAASSPDAPAVEPMAQNLPCTHEA